MELAEGIRLFRKFLLKHNVYEAYLRLLESENYTITLRTAVNDVGSWSMSSEGYSFWNKLHKIWYHESPLAPTCDRTTFNELLKPRHVWLNKVKEI